MVIDFNDNPRYQLRKPNVTARNILAVTIKLMNFDGKIVGLVKTVENIRVNMITIAPRTSMQIVIAFANLFESQYILDFIILLCSSRHPFASHTAAYLSSASLISFSLVCLISLIS